ncbi:hypothetical protein C2G38_2180367 [Gigaspora rosea]|uniref:Uncharacterized protein n=1 Tax=Gigaspora rosea TaxID=44941 RepID=A0A397VJC1_9GLOM|nr:hypothetical protein C2G38_2180367 [Gigaspora rosea]
MCIYYEPEHVQFSIELLEQVQVQVQFASHWSCKVNEEEPLTVNQVFIDELTWKVLLGSQVIADESDIIKKLPKQLCENFMKPARNMMPTTLPGRWKESNEKLAEITDEILETCKNDSWNNSAFSPEEAEVLNKGTYLTNLIFPAIRASLKNLHMENSPILARKYERQSIASADRRKYLERCPDIIFVMMDKGKKYELMYTECSCLFCTEQKIKDDAGVLVSILYGTKDKRRCSKNMAMQSEIDGSIVTDSLKQYIAKLEVENDKIKAENVELKARIVKSEDKQLQNELIKNLLSIPRKT